MTGFQYDRQDVTARGLANWYAQLLGTIFTESPKPYEVEIVVAEVGKTEDDDQIYRITFDGSVADEHGFVVMGGQADQVAAGAQGPILRRHDAVAGVHHWPSRPWPGQGNGDDERNHRRPARGGPAGPEPAAPDVPAADRRPAGDAADRGHTRRRPRHAEGSSRPARAAPRQAPAQPGEAAKGSGGKATGGQRQGGGSGGTD